MLFLRESLIMYKLDHPSIVKFVGSNFKSFRDPSIFEPTIITEYLEHGSLKDNLNKEKRSISDSEWTPTKKYISLIGISDAMRYLHEHGIVHQDLKPENILVDNLYYPRVCDFGLSRCFSESFSKSLKLTMTGEKGTPLYMAPELLRGDEHYDPSVDVYAFSILTYEIVSNKEPYFELGEKVTPYTFMDKVIKGYRPKRVPGITDKMWNLLCRCWSGDAKERPTFEYIFNELSKDRSYFSEFFDEEEFNEYLDVLKESREKDMKKSSSLSKEADGLIQKLKEENDKFKKKNDENEATIEKLKKEVRSLKSKIKDYKKEHDSLSSSDSNVYSGLLSLLGQKSMRDYKDAIHQLSFSSTKGNRYSSFILGLLYEIGEEVEKDRKLSFKYYEDSANQGFSYGFHRIGVCYELGKIVTQDYSKAIEYYQKAADLGNTYSLHRLGWFYDKGEHIAQDHSKAIEYYQKAAELGNLSSLNKLGIIYKNGQKSIRPWTRNGYF